MPANGVAVVQDDTTPSSIGGRGFSHFFGLNDLVDAARPSFLRRGLAGPASIRWRRAARSDFKVMTPDGRRALDVAVPVTGASFSDQIAALNNALRASASMAASPSTRRDG
jgi:flagellar hook-associated protein 1 FlgK